MMGKKPGPMGESFCSHFRLVGKSGRNIFLMNDSLKSWYQFSWNIVIITNIDIRSEASHKEFGQDKERVIQSAVETKIGKLQAELREEMRLEMAEIKKYFTERIENLEKRRSRGGCQALESRISKSMDEMMKSQLKQEHILRAELKLQFENLRQELVILYEEKNKRREAWILIYSV